MIERDFVQRRKMEYQIEEFIKQNLKDVGLSHVRLQRTPLGEKIIIFASRPGLIIGGGGTNIKKLTKQLKKKFGLENPQIEISEVTDVTLVSAVVAERIATALEKYGTMRFKGIGHKAMADALNAGARGIEILISGKIPSARARTWRFYQGYIKKSGNAALTSVDVAYASAKLKSGIVGIKVRIMPPDVRLPDDIRYKEVSEQKTETPAVEQVKEEPALEIKGEEISEKKSEKKKSKKSAEKSAEIKE
jgi:small subunit ribosomal protein S3